MTQPAPLQPANARRHPSLAVRARAGDNDVVAQALENARAASSVKQVEEEIKRIENAVATARRAKDPQLASYEAALAEAKDRAVAVRVLAGLADVPRATVVRNPTNSSERSTLSQAAQARSFMAGYEGVGGFRAFLAKVLPWFFKHEATPAFDKLPAAQKKAYMAVAKEADAAGQLALRAMLLDGRLTPALIEQLDQMAKMNADPAVDRRLLVSQTLVELADPVAVTQASRGTCAATSIQILMATEKPLLYVELLRGLASPGGSFRLPGGEMLRREPDWAYANDGGRSIPSRLIQPALMELGNGDLDYVNELDADKTATGQTLVSGLETSQADMILRQLAPDAPTRELLSPTYVEDLPEATSRALDRNIRGPNDWLMLVQNPKVIDPKSQDALIQRLAAQATPAHPLFATIVFAPDANRARIVFHAVLVQQVKDGMVDYVNPWGQVERVSVETFKRSVVNVLTTAEPAKP